MANFFESKTFQIICWVMIGLGVIGLITVGVTAETINEFIGLVFVGVAGVVTIVLFVMNHIMKVKMKKAMEATKK